MPIARKERPDPDYFHVLVLISFGSAVLEALANPGVVWVEVERLTRGVPKILGRRSLRAVA